MDQDSRWYSMFKRLNQNVMKIRITLVPRSTPKVMLFVVDFFSLLLDWEELGNLEFAIKLCNFLENIVLPEPDSGALAPCHPTHLFTAKSSRIHHKLTASLGRP